MKYLVDNPTAKPSDVAKACKCSVKYVYNIGQRLEHRRKSLSKKLETKHTNVARY